MTDKQSRFVEEYLVDFNGTQAAIRSGYSKNTANRIASQNLTKLDISEEIEKRKKEIFEQLSTDQISTLKEIIRLCFTDPRKVFDEEGNLKSIKDLDRDTAAAISGFDISINQNSFETTKKVRFWDKNKALELLSRCQGLFKDTSLNLNLNNLNAGVIVMPAKKPVGAPVEENIEVDLRDLEKKE